MAKTKPRLYAEGTEVAPEKSRAEIERLVKRHGATAWGYHDDEGAGFAAIYFHIGGRRIRFRVDYPSREQMRGDAYNRSDYRQDWQLAVAQEAEYRRRWRSLLFSIKSRLDMVLGGVETLDQAFLPYILIDGSTDTTVYEQVTPRLLAAYSGRSADRALVVRG